MRGAAVSLCVLLLGGLVLDLATAAAQTSSQQGLEDRVNRLQREIQTLQQHLYRGGKPGAKAPTQAPVSTEGGPSGAASPAIGGNARYRADLEVRLTQLEDVLRQATGSNEEIQHAISQLTDRLTKLIADVDVRLGALEQNAGDRSPGLGAAARPAPSGQGAQGSMSPQGQRVAPGSGQQPIKLKRPAPGPQSLGQIPASDMRAAAPPALPKGTPQQQYDQAIALILETQDYSAAEQSLRAFLAANSDHALVPNAHYWLGRTYFVRKDYQQAAYVFAEGFQKYPKSPKATANLFNLGMSLAQQGKTREACTAYDRLLRNYPNDETGVRARAKGEKSRLQCR